MTDVSVEIENRSAEAIRLTLAITDMIEDENVIVVGAALVGIIAQWVIKAYAKDDRRAILMALHSFTLEAMQAMEADLRDKGLDV